MAQASSAQREPSMEEILASIRRIIEDSDQVGRKPGDGLQRLDHPGERSEGAVIEVDAFRAELRGRAERDPALRLAESALADAAATLGEVKEQMAGEAKPDDEPFGALSSSERTEKAFSTRQAAASELNVEPVAGEAMQQAPDAPVEGGEPAAAPAEPRSLQASRPAIISEQPGRQVAAAFSELSEAFAASRRKSFDEMAEEMLRPMLQDWLDNNLPTLVERLVREEIERVARGG
ncbi:PopZ family protein [Mesorhizobium sp. 1B3]|uniref:PopZ family protein n=1 Tax=Mesorhizobium sp. 1B3 TaxID=3243599 RepID=UPI003D95154D